MLAINGGAAQLENVGPKRLVGRKIELLRGVVSPVARGGRSGLHPVSADDASGELLFYKQVLAIGIELIGIQAGLVGIRQPLVQFDVEDFEAQAAGGLAVFLALGQPQPVTANFGMNARLGGGQGWKVCLESKFYQRGRTNG